MNKQEFLNQLREKLHVLNDEELEALIQEYDETINDAMADGKSEEEAVASFGDLDELVRELLDAYKLRQPQQKKSVDLAEEGKKAVEKLGSVSLLSVTEWIIIAFALIICYILIHICMLLTSGVFNLLLNFFFNSYGLYRVIRWIFIAIELVVDILLTIKVVKGRMNGLQMAEVFNLEYLFDLDASALQLKQFKRNKNENAEEKAKEVVSEEPKGERFQFRKKEKVIRERKSLNFGSSLWNLIKTVFKLFVLIVALPFVLMAFILLVVGVIGSAASLVLSFTGYPLIGISIAGLGGCMALAALFYLFIQLFKHENILVAGGIFLGGLIFCGIGAGVSFLEYTNLEVVYANEEKLVDQEKIELPDQDLIYLKMERSNFDIRYGDVDKIEISTYDNGYLIADLKKVDELNYEVEFTRNNQMKQESAYDEIKEFLKYFRENIIYVDNYHPSVIIRLPHDADFTLRNIDQQSIVIGSHEAIEEYIQEQEEMQEEGV